MKTARRIFESHPLSTLWLAGIALRLFTAWFALGFFARDDYFHVLDIALAWIEDPEFIWETSERAGAGIRSHLLPRIVQGLLLLADTIGLTSPSAQLRFVYSVMGLYASLVVPATWFAMRDDSARARLYGTLLAAGHFVLPYAGTRLLIEATAIVPLVWGIGFARRALNDSQWRAALLAGVLIGLACWWRYQVGASGLAVAGVLLWRRRWSSVLALATGALFALTLQGLFDVATTGTFLGPLRNNITVNLAPHDALTRSGPLSYFGLWLALTIPPLSIGLVPLLVIAGRKAPMVSIPWVAFVVFHSLIPHKEERFMLPAVPLFLILLALTPDVLDDA
ncbi:MAG: hypothetical protein AAF658_01730, partial [Myxococcota bacterium]